MRDTTMRCRYRVLGGHVHCRFFLNGNAGTLVFAVDEWSDVVAAMPRVEFIDESETYNVHLDIIGSEGR